MNRKGDPDEYLLDNLKERAKELNCLYRVDEILNDQRLSLTEMFNQLTMVIPSGWQYPEICKARIVYDNRSYQTPGFYSSPYMESVPIKLDGQVMGRVEVVYTQAVEKGPEGYFLEKERKLLKTIADRIEQTILRRHMEMVLQEWNTSRQINGERKVGNEWMIIIDFLGSTDQSLLL